jgi:hypothetical protein
VTPESSSPPSKGPPLKHTPTWLTSSISAINIYCPTRFISFLVYRLKYYTCTSHLIHACFIPIYFHSPVSQIITTAAVSCVRHLLFTKFSQLCRKKIFIRIWLTHGGTDLRLLKAVPLQAWGGPEGSRKLRFPDFLTTAQDGGKVVSLTHRPHLPPVNIPSTHFC